MKKVVLVLSGGQDSTTCAFWARQQWGSDAQLHAVTFNYGQRHAREIESAVQIAELVEATSHEIINLGAGILRGTSPLVSGAPLEQYADHKSLPGGLEKTFVPMRNQLFLTLAANRAYVLGCSDLVTGVCQEDYGGYPDCRDAFIWAFENVSNLGTFTGKDGAVDSLQVHTPLMNLTKAESIGLAMSLPGCYEALQYTHTSYDGAYPPTGHDHATLLRAKGFEEAGVPDPLVLRAVQEGLMELPTSINYSFDAARRIRALLPECFHPNAGVINYVHR